MGTLAESAKNDSDPLIQMEQEWNQALKTHDIAWFEKNLADDFTDISSGNGGLTTKGDDIANLKGDKTVYDSLELSNPQAPGRRERRNCYRHESPERTRRTGPRP